MNHWHHNQNTDLLSGRISTKANRIRRSYSHNSKPPQVMVKVSGFCHSASHTQVHFDYISRNGNVEIEDELGHKFQQPNAITELAKSWQDSNTTSYTQQNRNARHSTHLVLSMPNGTEPKAVKQAVRSFAKSNFADNHRYVMALHTDTDSPHVHLTIRNLGFDGKRLHIKKGLPQQWREDFANQLEELCIAADATPSLKAQTRSVFRIRSSRERDLELELELESEL
ncbi:relaxase/mobilization nuclease domain-containing protein [Shewanella sp. 202IG2-18]|uniref:relaxase/mobilization nuclease domain-containing protein n=1 Tax=Parashewanella hymeniacidonis TaxID=2807618 RepID=UPI00196034DC|nr:relaxase/mobilization nuclease domain-containing protein [Parashewanella hymeniacidonis]MBM7074487.1 relaxase/mobilization nuclease domain-containing protein [Parashewanella hymeniacidonis]